MELEDKTVRHISVAVPVVLHMDRAGGWLHVEISGTLKEISGPRYLTSTIGSIPLGKALSTEIAINNTNTCPGVLPQAYYVSIVLAP